ncbi:hypothetical protein MPSEU_000943200 [Mayamaea pseudoterrestris]|nr:hypothetical protein MPSEU_000943200 [Mayamaea pseudoterrestris]
MESTAASSHYTIRTESGKVIQMSQEEMSQLVRKTMKRAKDESPRQPLISTTITTTPRHYRKRSESPEKRKRSPTKSANETRDDSFGADNRKSPSTEVRDSGADYDDNRLSSDAYHDRDDLARQQPTFESYTVNTELEGSKQLSQSELNMLVRNSIIKARQQTRALHESSPHARHLSTPNRLQRKPKRDATKHLLPEQRKKCDVADAQAEGNRSNCDAVSVADTEPSQLTEPSALRRITDELSDGKRGKLGSSGSSASYLDSESDVHEDVLRNARRMLQGMTEASDPIETIRNAHPLSPIVDDEGTAASKESKKQYFFPDTPLHEKTTTVKESPVSAESAPSREKQQLVTPLSALEERAIKHMEAVVQAHGSLVGSKMPGRADLCIVSTKSSKSERSKPNSGSILNHASSKSTGSQVSSSSFPRKETSKEKDLISIYLPHTLESDCSMAAPEDTAVADEQKKPTHGSDDIVGDKIGKLSEADDDEKQNLFVSATATRVPNKKQIRRPRSLSRGKERLAQFNLRNTPKKQIAAWAADPVKEKNRSDPEEIFSTKRDSPTMEPDADTALDCACPERQTKLDPVEEAMPGWTKSSHRDDKSEQTHPLSEDLNNNADRQFSDREIENIVHNSMDRAQQTARVEIQELLNESKRHKDKIGLKTNDGYKLLSQDEIADLVKESMRKAREAAQHEIAELVRDSMKQARESAQAEIKELVQDSMRRAREAAMMEMSEIVKDSLQNARADESTVVSMSAFTLNTVPAYQKAMDVVPAVPAVGISLPYCNPEIYSRAHPTDTDTIPEEVMSGSVFEGIDPSEGKKRETSMVIVDEHEHSGTFFLERPDIIISHSLSVEQQIEASLPTVLESTLVLHGKDVYEHGSIDNHSENESGEVMVECEEMKSAFGGDKPAGGDKYEVTAIVKKHSVRGTNLCFGYSTHSASSSISSKNEAPGIDKKEGVIVESEAYTSPDKSNRYQPESLTGRMESQRQPNIGGTNFCGVQTQEYDDEPCVEEIVFVTPKKVTSNGSRMSKESRTDISSSSKTSQPSGMLATKYASTTRLKASKQSPSVSLSRDNLAPMSPSGWTHASPAPYASSNVSDDHRSRTSKYSRGHLRQMLVSKKPVAFGKKESVIVTDELLAQIANLKGATITHDELSKILSPPRQRKTSRPSKSSSKAKQTSDINTKPLTKELEVVETKFCVNFMDLLSLDDEDGYTRAGSHSLASSYRHSKTANWVGVNARGDTDIEGTFTGTDNEYSIEQSFSPNEYSTFSEASDDVR